MDVMTHPWGTTSTFKRHCFMVQYTLDDEKKYKKFIYLKLGLITLKVPALNTVSGTVSLPFHVFPMHFPTTFPEFYLYLQSLTELEFFTIRKVYFSKKFHNVLEY